MGRANTSRIPYTGFAGMKPDGKRREPMVREERQHGSCAGWCSGNLNVFLPRPIATCTSTIFYGATVLLVFVWPPHFCKGVLRQSLLHLASESVDASWMLLAGKRG